MRNIFGILLCSIALCLPVFAQTATDEPSTPKPTRQKTQKAKPKKTTSSQSGFTCGGKRKCAEMSSCEEAYFYLKQCGLKRLDRDKDGIPCEKICGG